MSYAIFLRDGFLFAYSKYVGDDHDRDLAAMADDPTTRAWWKLTDLAQQPVVTAAEGEHWVTMTEVFHAR